MFLMFFVQSILPQCVFVVDIFQKRSDNRLFADAREISRLLFFEYRQDKDYKKDS